MLAFLPYVTRSNGVPVLRNTGRLADTSFFDSKSIPCQSSYWKQPLVNVTCDRFQSFIVDPFAINGTHIA